MRYCCKFLLDSCRPDLEFIAKMIDKTCIERLEQVGGATQCGWVLPAETVSCWAGAGDGGKALLSQPMAQRHISSGTRPPRPPTTQVANSSFKRVSYTEAIEILEGVVASGKKQFEFPVSWGIDLQVGRGASLV